MRSEELSNAETFIVGYGACRRTEPFRYMSPKCGALLIPASFRMGAMNRLIHHILNPHKNIYKDIGEKFVKFMIKMLQIPLILFVS